MTNRKEKAQTGLKFALMLALGTAGSMARAQEESAGFRVENDSQVAIVVANGNSKSETYSINQVSTGSWAQDVLRFDARFLKATTSLVESDKNYLIGLRYERVLSTAFNVFAAQNLESDIYKGFNQRYNSDAGFKYFIVKDVATKPEMKDLNLFTEAGYRYSFTNLGTGAHNSVNFIRLYAEVEKYFTPGFSGKYWVEALPNLTHSNGYRINTEASISSSLNSLFSLKVGFLLKVDNEPEPGVRYKDDTVFTTALAAKF